MLQQSFYPLEQSVGLRVNQTASEAKHLISKTKSHYITEGRSLPQEVASQVRNIVSLFFRNVPLMILNE